MNSDRKPAIKRVLFPMIPKTIFVFSWVLLLTLGFLLTNCNQATLVNTASRAEAPSDSNKTYTVVMGVYEIGNTNEAICPEGRLTRIEIKRNFVDSIIHIFFGGFFTTRTQEIYCE